MQKILYMAMVCCLSASLFAQKEISNIKKGNEHYTQKEYDKAQTEYQSGVEHNDKSFEAHFNMGNALYRQQKFEEALQQYVKSAELTKDTARLASAFHNAGNALLEEKKYENSIQAYKRSLKMNPADDETRYNLAVAQHLLKKQQDEQNKDNKDKEDNKKNQQQQQKQQPKPQQPEMSKEQAEKILQALQQDEKDTQDKRKVKIPTKSKAEKEW
ncbi:MAG: tetratricopeptide repeat protein [Prevotellaceae bacterium]|jgi:tetratricopeptide (TPR) repeat protein|nr:tetratricopeptide repeat protein [Prevotellaceae bacterium]